MPNPLDCSPAEQFYLDNNQSMLLLATLSIGARDARGLPLIDVQNDPWNKIPKKTIKLSMDALCAEIRCCWNTLQREGKEPASKHWDKNKMIKWLEEHPINLADDLAFLKHEQECRHQRIAKRKNSNLPHMIEQQRSIKAGVDDILIFA